MICPQPSLNLGHTGGAVMDDYKIAALEEARTKWRDLFDRARAAGL